MAAIEEPKQAYSAAGSTAVTPFFHPPRGRH